MSYHVQAEGDDIFDDYNPDDFAREGMILILLYDEGQKQYVNLQEYKNVTISPLGGPQ